MSAVTDTIEKFRAGGMTAADLVDQLGHYDYVEHPLADLPVCADPAAVHLRADAGTAASDAIANGRGLDNTFDEVAAAHARGDLDDDTFEAIRAAHAQRPFVQPRASTLAEFKRMLAAWSDTHGIAV